MKQQMFWLGPEDEAAIALLKQRYGCESKSQVVRLALRVLAENPPLHLLLPPTPKHASKPGRSRNGEQS